MVRTLAVVLSAIGIILFAGCKKPNHAPDTPAVPSGPASCAVGVSYAFSSSAADPDGDSVSIRFDWGDGDTSEWSSCAASGDSMTMSHSWSSPGAFSVNAQARDKDSVVTAWSSACNLGVLYEWSRTFGGVGADVGYMVEQTQDGGYVVVGFTDSYGAGSRDAWLVKTTATGETVWTRTYGGTGDDRLNSVHQTADGGYVAAGFTQSFGAGGCDVWLIKTDANGDTVWTRTFGGIENDLGFSVRQTSDGGYVITGETRSCGAGEDDVWLIKTDANGDTAWTRTYGGTGADVGSAVQQTQDGGYVVTGLTEPSGECYDVWLLKTDASGDTAWTVTYGGVDVDEGIAIQQTQDGGYIITGSTELGAGNGDVWLIKTDANGDTVWTRTFGGTDIDWGYAVQQTTDGGYIVAGCTWSSGVGGEDFWLIRTDANGNGLWDRAMGGVGDDAGSWVQQTLDGGYIVVGTTHSYGAGPCDVWLVKTGPNGEMDEGGGK